MSSSGAEAATATAKLDVLRFGTDGWRDRIGERFTVANVRRAAHATALHVRERGGERVLVAHDTRFGAEMFAAAAADTLAGHGLRVELHEGPLPTPVLSFAVRHLGADAGVMLTASHNPPLWNGFKLKDAYGGTVAQETYARVAELTRQTRHEDVPDPGAAVGRFDVREAYFAHLSGLLDLELLRGLSGTLVHDAMGGAAAGWVRGFVERAGLPLRVEEIRGEPDPLFHGAHPEPLPGNLGPTLARMGASGAGTRAGSDAWRPEHDTALLATANDGDGDRLAAIAPGGRYLNSHEIFALLLDRLARRSAGGAARREGDGPAQPGADDPARRVVKTFTVSRLVERLAEARGLPVTETPVGFKHLVPELLAGDVLIAGEESGGIGIPEHLPERDGIANTLFLLEALAACGGDLLARLAELEREAGWRHAYDRRDLPLADARDGERITAALADPPERFAGRAIISVERLDGVKLNLDGGAWLLFRASGTEPLLRVYCEAQTPDEVDAILRAAESHVAGLPTR